MFIDLYERGEAWRCRLQNPVQNLSESERRRLKSTPAGQHWNGALRGGSCATHSKSRFLPGNYISGPYPLHVHVAAFSAGGFRFAHKV
jgi:hypothetical protein